MKSARLRPQAWALTAGRGLNTFFFLFTSIYCLLTYSPFAYEQFIQPHVIAWVSNFVVLYADFYWLALCVTALTLVPLLRSVRLQRAAWLYLGVGTAIGIVISIRPVLPGDDHALWSLSASAAALVPVFWLAILDHVAGGNGFDASDAAAREPDADAPAVFGQRVCLATAVFVWALYALLAIERLRAAGGLVQSTGALAIGIAMSAIAHLTVFALLFLILTVISRTTAGWRRARAAAHAIRLVLWCAGATLVFQRVVFTPISIGGGIGWMMAAAVGSALVLSTSGMVRLHAAVPPSRLAAVVTLLCLPVVAFIALRVVTTFDWGFMLQKLSALAVASIAFGAIGVLAGRGSSRARDRGQAALPVAAMILFATGAVAAPHLAAWTHDARLDAIFALDAYAAGDPSFRLIRQFLEDDEALTTDADFFSYLRANSSIKEAVAPVSIDFAAPLPPSPAHRPDIYLFVIDSLRRDYVSAYNPAVGFTPAFDAFARDSFVFDRAFTRYGGTGLAVPAIWAGAMLLHKQYVTPFAPMNALAKLIDAEGYRRAVTFDHITDELFGFPEGGTALDRVIPEMTHTFCGTVDELEADLLAHANDGRPVFAHTRPLDLHIGNTRLAAVPAGESYPGFFGPYASRVHRIDACFGGFLDFLAHTNRYDNSIVILTSDHGDSLGEGLRWGHGYTVFPEVIRIPLMIHLPRAIRDRVTTDPTRVTFATDITPTLYALLGYQTVRPRAAAGSPLFVDRAASLDDRRSESFLVASSYGAVYGLVQEDGGRLYIADAIEGRDYLFNLSPTGADLRVGITDAERQTSRRQIRDKVADLAAWYGRR